MTNIEKQMDTAKIDDIMTYDDGDDGEIQVLWSDGTISFVSPSDADYIAERGEWS